MNEAVADNKVGYVQYGVVCADLFEDLLCDSYSRSLIFDDDTRAQILIIQHTVAASPLRTNSERHLICQKGGGEALMFD